MKNIPISLLSLLSLCLANIGLIANEGKINRDPVTLAPSAELSLDKRVQAFFDDLNQRTNDNEENRVSRSETQERPEVSGGLGERDVQVYKSDYWTIERVVAQIVPVVTLSLDTSGEVQMDILYDSWGNGGVFEYLSKNVKNIIDPDVQTATRWILDQAVEKEPTPKSKDLIIPSDTPRTPPSILKEVILLVDQYNTLLVNRHLLEAKVVELNTNTLVKLYRFSEDAELSFKIWSNISEGHPHGSPYWQLGHADMAEKVHEIIGFVLQRRALSLLEHDL